MEPKFTQNDRSATLADGAGRDRAGWTRAPGWVIADPLDAARSGPGPCVLCPVLAGLGPELADIAAALPIGNANAALIRALDRLDQTQAQEGGPESEGVAHLIAGVFGNDPFCPLDDVFAALAASGVGAIANWPSVGLLSGELAEQLTSAGYVFEKEMAMLQAARKTGLEAIAFVCTEDQAETAHDIGAAMIVVAPPPASDEAAGRTQAAAAAHRTLTRLRSRTVTTELRLYTHAAHGDSLATATPLADGLITFATA